ncbi:MAG: hypothetical protein ATN31_02090 [Candidatus Epulonipiscioides saccharophilum]|nr:MAG: hypothetical protein ATN31_02090 [Epulopiscium sp. AS2M-Bin001]
MSLITKYNKQIAMALLAAGITSATPLTATAQPTMSRILQESIAALSLAPMSRSSQQNVTGLSLESIYQLDAILEQSLKYYDMPTSSMSGMDLQPNTQYLPANSSALAQLKDLLDTEQDFNGIGALDQIQQFVSKLSSLNSTLASELKDNGSNFADTYVEKINELKKLIHVVDQHLDLAADVPAINFDNVIYGENSGHFYQGVELKGALKVVEVSNSYLAKRYPIPNLIWPKDGKPEHIKIAVTDLFNNVFVNELGMLHGDDIPYKSGSTLGYLNLVDQSPEVLVTYTLRDSFTGKENYFNLLVRYIDTTQNFSRAISLQGIQSPGHLLESPKAIPINISDDGREIPKDKYWVTPQIYSSLKQSMDDALKLVMNVYKDLDFGTLGVDSMEEKFESELYVLFKDETLHGQFNNGYVEVLKPDETPYLFSEITAGTMQNHSSTQDLEAAYNNLTQAYNDYYTSATLGKGTLLEELKSGQLETQVAKAMLGLQNITVALPTDTDEDILKNLVYLAEDGYANPVYLYTKKATKEDVTKKTKQAADKTQVAQEGDLILAPKDEADSIMKYDDSSSIQTPLNSLDEDTDYFIAPIITNDPYLVGKSIPGGSNSQLPEAKAMKYLTIDDVRKQISKLNPLFAEYDLYNGTDSSGNSLQGQAYLDEIKAGSVQIEPGLTKLQNVLDKIATATTDLNLREGEQHQKQIAVDNLAKLLIHLGYYTSESFGTEIKSVADLNATSLNSQQLFNGGGLSAQPSNNITSQSEFDVYNFVDADFDDISVRGIDKPYYNISNVYGIDIPGEDFWVDELTHENLKKAALRAHNLLHSNYITATKADISAETYKNYENYNPTSALADQVIGPDKAITNSDYFFYTTELVKDEVQKLQDALNDYNSASSTSNKNNFLTYVSDLHKLLFAASPSDALKAGDYFSLAEYDQDNKISKQRSMKSASNTFLSEDGIFAITREILSSSLASGDSISSIQNKQLICPPLGGGVGGESGYRYVTPAQLNQLESAVKPYYQLVNLQSKIEDYGTHSNDSDFVAQAQKFAKDYFDNLASSDQNNSLPTIKNQINAALDTFVSQKKPIVIYAQTRDDLRNQVTSARTLVAQDPDTSVIYPVNQSLLVISDDSGFSYKEYDKTNHVWKDAEFFTAADSNKKWISSSDLKAFHESISYAENIIEKTRAKVYEIDNKNTPSKADDTKVAELLDGEPSASGIYAEANIDSSYYNKIVDALNDDDNKDFFQQISDSLATAKSNFIAAQKDRDTSASTAKDQYEAFIAEIGQCYTVISPPTPPLGGGQMPQSQTELGYVSTSATYPDFSAQNASELKARVYGIKDTTGKITSYFPVDVYVVDDNLGIINPLTKELYGQGENSLVNDNSEASTPPTKFVHEDMAAELISAIETIDKFIAKPLSEHLIAYKNDPAYFDNQLTYFEEKVTQFDNAVQPHKADDYIAAYQAVVTNILPLNNGALDNNSTLIENVSKFSVANSATPNTKVVALKLDSGAISNGELVDKTKIILGDNVYISEDGVSKKPDKSAMTASDYWVTPKMFENLQEAIWNVYELYEDAKSNKKSQVEGYAKNPEYYFENQLKKIDLDTAIDEFKLMKVLQAAGTGQKAEWVKAAKIILYGKESGGDADGPGGTDDEADANISSVTDGFDVLTLSLLEEIDDDHNGISDTEKNLQDDEIIYYFEADYIKDLKQALKNAEASNSDTNIQALAKQVNLAESQKKIVAISNNPKIDLYNSYIEAKNALKKDGLEILASDNNGLNIPIGQYWTTSATLNRLKFAIETSKSLLNQNQVLKDKEASYLSLIERQQNENSYSIRFEPKAGQATSENVELYKSAKEKLLDTINQATDLAGQKAYDESGQRDENSVISDKAIVVSTFGLDVYGEDRDNNFIPDTGDRWTTQISKSAIDRAITSAITAYNSGSSTEKSLDLARNNLLKAIETLETNSKYGTLSTYQRVVNHMQTYITNILEGNSGYSVADPSGSPASTEGIGRDLEPIIAANQVKDSLAFGADISPTDLWCSKIDRTRLISLADASEKILAAKCDIANGVTMDLTSLLREHDKLKQSYESFYGRDIFGHYIDNMVAKAKPGTKTVSTIELRLEIEKAVARVNNLVYIENASRPTLRYTKFDGTPNNEYGYDMYDIINGTYINDGDGNGNDGSATDTLVTNKMKGEDIPISREWITYGPVAQYTQAINAAQIALDNFEAQSEDGGSQQILTNAINALKLATTRFEDAQKTKVSNTDVENNYRASYQKLKEGIKRAYSLIGKDEFGLDSVSVPYGGDEQLTIEHGISQIRASQTSDGQEVDENHHWVPANTMKAYLLAIQTAVNASKNNLATKASLDVAFGRLQTATNTITNVAKDKEGQAEEKESALRALKDLIEDTYSLINGGQGSGPDSNPLVESSNSDNVSENYYWTTTNNYNTLVSRLKSAELAIERLEIGGTTLVALKSHVTNLGAILDTITDNKVLGTSDSETGSGQIIEAKLELQILLKKAQELLTTKQSAKEGRDIADNINWVTSKDVAGFTESDGGTSISDETPIEFLTEARQTAQDIYNAKYPQGDIQTQDQILEEYEEAVENLAHCIGQFANVLENSKPDGDDLEEGVEDVGGTGSLTSITEAKKVLQDRITLVNNDIKTTREVDGMDFDNLKFVKDGMYYALKDDLATIRNAVSNAQAKVSDRTFQYSVAQLTGGSLDGKNAGDEKTKSGTDIDANGSALAKLNKIYELFAGVDDGNNNTDPAEIQRKLKGPKKIEFGSDSVEATPLSEAASAVIELFTSDDESKDKLPIIPVSLVTDSDGNIYSASDISNAHTVIENYLEALIKNVINNNQITVEVSDLPTSASASDYTAPDQDDLGHIQKFTVVLKYEDHPVAAHWTIQSASGINSGTTFVTQADLKINIAKQEEKWNTVSKADIISAAGQIIANEENIFVSDNLYNYGAANDIENTKLIAKHIKKQIEELINNSNIEVTIYEKDTTIHDDKLSDNSSSHNPPENLTGATSEDAIIKNPEQATSEKKDGENGEFKYKVVLAIKHDNITGLGSRAGFNEDNHLAEVIKDDGNSSADKTKYTVLLKNELTAKIKAEPYQTVYTNDMLATIKAKEILVNKLNGGNFVVENTIENPGNTIALANAQISKKVTELLSQASATEKSLIEKVTFEIVEDLTGTGFEAPTTEDDGSYKFKIVFKQNTATTIYDATPITINQTDEDLLMTLKEKIEKFNTFSEDLELTDENGSTQENAVNTLQIYIDSKKASSIETKVVGTGYRAPTKSTATRHGVAGWVKFEVRLKLGDRETKTFELLADINASAYVQPMADDMWFSDPIYFNDENERSFEEEIIFEPEIEMGEPEFEELDLEFEVDFVAEDVELESMSEEPDLAFESGADEMELEPMFEESRANEMDLEPMSFEELELEFDENSVLDNEDFLESDIVLSDEKVSTAKGNLLGKILKRLMRI